MADRPGLVRMIAAAFLAASVASSTAMPHCAAERAGASFTPEKRIEDRGYSVWCESEVRSVSRTMCCTSVM